MSQPVVHIYPITTIFDIDGNYNKLYKIPLYQRAYSWDKNDWEKLFDDIKDNDKGYFLGSIIHIRNKKGSHEETHKLDVVDGQQRLITLSLLLLAIYKILKQKNDTKKLEDKQIAALCNLEKRIVWEKKEPRVIPQKQDNNKKDYLSILSKINIIEGFNPPAKNKNSNIFDAFAYFEDRVDKIIKEESDLNLLLSFLEQVTQSCLVTIEVNDHEQAYILFESLNNRGKQLTPIDLIKNEFLSNLEVKESEKTIEKYADDWDILLKDIGDDYGVQERFFRHYYNAFKKITTLFGSVSDNKRIATRSNLIGIYRDWIKQDAKKHLKDILEAGRIYSWMLDRPDYFPEERRTVTQKRLLALDRVQGTPSHLLMLYLLKKKEEKELSIEDADIQKIIDILVSFFVRRNLTNIPPTRDINRLFIKIIDDISSLSSNDVVETIRKNLMEAYNKEFKDVATADEFFSEKLRGDIYRQNKGIARFILCALEEDLSSKEEFNLWQPHGKGYFWTIEHILPQGKNIPQEWVNMVADGDQKKAKEIQESHVHKLGNLTLSAYNSKLGNKSFIEKRDIMNKERKAYVGYKNRLEINKKVANKLDGGLRESWTKEDIDERTKEMADKAFRLFKLDK